jgi:parallel beta-helix repeat protein
MTKYLIFAILALSAAALAQTTVQVPYSGTVPITIPAGCTLNSTSTTGGTLSATVSCPVVAPVTPPLAGRTKLVPSGGTDNAAIYAAAAKGPIELGCPLAIPCAFALHALSLPANTNLWCDDGVTISDVAGYLTYDQMIAVAVNNVTLAGSGSANACLFTMVYSYRKNAVLTDKNVNQYNNCIWIKGASNVTVTGLRFNQCGGDSIYVSTSSNVTVSHNTSSDPIRNGCSATDNLTSVVFDSNDFSGAHNALAGISDGCDVEPNTSTGVIKGLALTNNYWHDNAGDGVCLCFFFTRSTTPIDVTVTGNRSDRNGKAAFDKSNWPVPMTGAVKFSGNTVNGAAVNP